MEVECKTLWMGDIQPNWDEAFVASLFASCNEQPVIKMIRDKITGYPSGYGFLEFPSQEGARYVLENFNGQIVPNTVQRFRMNWGAGGRRIESQSEDHSIFVGDLAPDVTDELLLSTFATRFSSVRNAKVVTDSLTRMSKGFGFVRFSSKEEAEQALQTMNGVYCSSRPMRVSVATDRNANRNRGEFGAGGGYGGGGVGGAAGGGGGADQGEAANTTVFIGGLEATTSEDELRQHFAPFGEIMSIKIPPGRGCGFVHFMAKNAAEMAISQMNGAQLGSAKIRCAWGRSAAVRAASGGAGGGGYYQHQQYGAAQYAQAAGYQGYYNGYQGYYPQYQQQAYAGYGQAGAYDQQNGAAAGQQQQGQAGQQAGYYGQGGHQGHGHGHGHGHSNRRQFQEPRDFTRPEDVEGANRRYATQRAYQHMAPVANASYSPMSNDVTNGTAMATQ